MIAVRGLRRVYRVGGEPLEVLRGVDLDIGAGELLAIVGPSGSGKSTLMHLLGALDRPSGGSYRYAGREVADLDEVERARFRREHIGFVFQGFHLLAQMSAWENVQLPMAYAGIPAPERRERARALLERLGLGERLRHRPNQLSGGQQQRVAIARALANEPETLLADEPTGNLDSRAGAEVMGLLGALHRDGRTVIIVTHDEAVAARCSRRVRMQDGRIREDVTRKAVRA